MLKNKKTFCIVLFSLITFAIFISCSNKKPLSPVNIEPVEIQKDGIFYEMNPRLELLLIALRLSDNHFVTSSSYYDESGYLEAVDSFFYKYKNHPFVKIFKKVNKNKESWFYSFYNIITYVSSDFTIIHFPDNQMPAYDAEVWGKINMDKFLREFNDFAVTTKFDRFVLANQAVIKKALYDSCEFFSVNEDFIPYLKKLLVGKNTPTVITCYSTPLFCGRFGNFPITNFMGNKEINLTLSPYFGYDNGNGFYFMSYYVSCYSNQLLSDHWLELSDSAENYIKDIFIQTQNPEKITAAVARNIIGTVIAQTFALDYASIYEKPEIYEEFSNYIYNEEVYKVYIPLSEKVTEYIKASPDNCIFSLFDGELKTILESL